MDAWLAAASADGIEGLDPVGYLATGPSAAATRPLGGGAIPCLGGAGDLEIIVGRYRISHVVFWSWPRGDAAELAVLGRLHRRRIRLRWRVDEAAVFGAGARPDAFAGSPSAVLEPDARSAPAALLMRLADIGAGALLTLLAAIPYCLLRPLAGLSAPRAADLAEAGGDGPPPRVVRGRDGRPKPLWWQAPLALSLLSGMLSVWGSRPDAPATSGSAGWNLDWRAPGLTGPWAGSDPRDPWRTLMFNPAGLGDTVPGAPGGGRSSDAQ